MATESANSRAQIPPAIRKTPLSPSDNDTGPKIIVDENCPIKANAMRYEIILPRNEMATLSPAQTMVAGMTMP